MNITEEVTFDKQGNVERFPLLRKLFLSLVLILVSVLSFGIGRLTGQGSSTPVKVEFDQSLDQQASAVTAYRPAAPDGTVIASKNGSKYYYPSCSGAKRISEANKVTFPNKTAAEAAGLALAANCMAK